MFCRAVISKTTHILYDVFGVHELLADHEARGTVGYESSPGYFYVPNAREVGVEVES